MRVLTSAFTHIPNSAPPKWAAWSKYFHPRIHPAISTPIMTLIAAPAEKVNIGKNIMLNWVSGYCVQM